MEEVRIETVVQCSVHSGITHQVRRTKGAGILGHVAQTHGVNVPGVLRAFGHPAVEAPHVGGKRVTACGGVVAHRVLHGTVEVVKQVVAVGVGGLTFHVCGNLLKFNEMLDVSVQ